MDNNFDNNLDPEQLSLEAILAEYRAEEEMESAHRSAVEQQSRSIMIEALGDTISSSVQEPEKEPEPVSEGFMDPDT